MSDPTPDGKPPEPLPPQRGKNGGRGGERAPGGARDAVSLTIAICLGIIRDQRVRRSVLFFVMMGVMSMIFAGTALFDRWLEKHPLVFLLYWGACLWLTFLSILMALYDMLMVRKAGAAERRRLAEEMKRNVSTRPPGE